jgi:hypothetical protein
MMNSTYVSLLFTFMIWKEIVNNDRQQFHQYQQNEQSPSLTEHKKSTTYDSGNLGPALQQTQKCGRVKLVNGIPNHHSC